VGETRVDLQHLLEDLHGNSSASWPAITTSPPAPRNGAKASALPASESSSGLLVSRDVLTETRRGTTHLASSWSLTSRYRAPWKWVPPPGLVAARGTAILLRLANPLSPLLDAGFLAEVIRRHFEPLLDSASCSAFRSGRRVSAAALARRTAEGRTEAAAYR
jgi:hypothetical protein